MIHSPLVSQQTLVKECLVSLFIATLVTFSYSICDSNIVSSWFMQLYISLAILPDYSHRRRLVVRTSVYSVMANLGSGDFTADMGAEKLRQLTIDEGAMPDWQKNSLIEKYQLMTNGELHSFDIITNQLILVTNFQQAKMFQSFLYPDLDRVTNRLTKCTSSI
jgi:hypothetical protein